MVFLNESFHNICIIDHRAASATPCVVSRYKLINTSEYEGGHSTTFSNERQHIRLRYCRYINTTITSYNKHLFVFKININTNHDGSPVNKEFLTYSIYSFIWLSRILIISFYFQYNIILTACYCLILLLWETHSNIERKSSSFHSNRAKTDTRWSSSHSSAWHDNSTRVGSSQLQTFSSTHICWQMPGQLFKN